MLHHQSSVLFIGAGQIASEVSAYLRSSPFNCLGFSRRPNHSTRNLSWRTADELAQIYSPSAVVFTLTPQGSDAHSYKQSYLNSLAHWLNTPALQTAKQIIWISSTRVYGHNDGSVVDQSTPAQPRDTQGNILLHCETLLLNAAPKHSLALRFPGLYGKQQHFENRLARLRSSPKAQAWPPRWENRLHRTDAAGLIAHCIENNITSTSPMITSDIAPSTQWETASWLANQLKIPLEPADHSASRGKRIVSDVHSTFGYRLQYPTWHHGYRALINQI